MRMYCVYDRLAEESSSIFEQKNDALAVRTFRSTFDDPRSPDPSSFQLMYLGTFDRDTAKVVAEPVPVVIPVPDQVRSSNE